MTWRTHHGTYRSQFKYRPSRVNHPLWFIEMSQMILVHLQSNSARLWKLISAEAWVSPNTAHWSFLCNKLRVERSEDAVNCFIWTAFPPRQLLHSTSSRRSLGQAEIAPIRGICHLGAHASYLGSLHREWDLIRTSFRRGPSHTADESAVSGDSQPPQTSSTQTIKSSSYLNTHTIISGCYY